jgi:hypothetical protein
LINSPIDIKGANAEKNSALHTIIDNFYNQTKSKETVLFIEPLVYCSNGRLNNLEKEVSGLTHPVLKENSNERKFLFNSIIIKSINKRGGRDCVEGGKSKVLINNINFIYTDSMNFTNVDKISIGKDVDGNSTE